MVVVTCLRPRSIVASFLLAGAQPSLRAMEQMAAMRAHRQNQIRQQGLEKGLIFPSRDGDGSGS
jgi:hypothetical protein